MGKNGHRHRLGIKSLSIIDCKHGVARNRESRREAGDSGTRVGQGWLEHIDSGPLIVRRGREKTAMNEYNGSELWETRPRPGRKISERASGGVRVWARSLKCSIKWYLLNMTNSYHLGREISTVAARDVVQCSGYGGYREVTESSNLTAERSCPCKQPACPTISGGGSEVTFKPLVPRLSVREGFLAFTSPGKIRLLYFFYFISTASIK
ncbi:hypothetical protein J6590_057398 [Homalodisca vitripennis]|nr:hypothetical protein J6590_057398 [Homalodisca vitripennis]